jgi:hypothetical protein
MIRKLLHIAVASVLYGAVVVGVVAVGQLVRSLFHSDRIEAIYHGTGWQIQSYRGEVALVWISEGDGRFTDLHGG